MQVSTRRGPRLRGGIPSQQAPEPPGPRSPRPPVPAQHECGVARDVARVQALAFGRVVAGAETRHSRGVCGGVVLGPAHARRAAHVRHGPLRALPHHHAAARRRLAQRDGPHAAHAVHAVRLQHFLGPGLGQQRRLQAAEGKLKGRAGHRDLRGGGQWVRRGEAKPPCLLEWRVSHSMEKERAACAVWKARMKLSPCGSSVRARVVRTEGEHGAPRAARRGCPPVHAPRCSSRSRRACSAAPAWCRTAAALTCPPR